VQSKQAVVKGGQSAAGLLTAAASIAGAMRQDGGDGRDLRACWICLLGDAFRDLLKGATDCKGFAIMKFRLARLPGLDDGELALLIGILPSTRNHKSLIRKCLGNPNQPSLKADTSTHQMHAVLLVATTGTPVVLDNRHADVVDIGAFGDFRPIVAGDLQGLHLFVADATGAGRPIEVTENHPISAGRPKDR
jgi:hypothetical protein